MRPQELHEVLRPEDLVLAEVLLPGEIAPCRFSERLLQAVARLELVVRSEDRTVGEHDEIDLEQTEAARPVPLERFTGVRVRMSIDTAHGVRDVPVRVVRGREGLRLERRNAKWIRCRIACV